MKSHRTGFGKQRLIGKRSRQVPSLRKFLRVHLENLEMRALLTGSQLLAQWENLADADVNETLPAARSILASSCAGYASSSALQTMTADVSAGQDLPTVADVPTASPQTVDEVFAEPLIEGQVAEFKLLAEDLSGNLITSINVGQNFKLAAYVEDLRSPANQLPGVWAAFMNVAYTASLVTITPGGDPPASDAGNTSDLAFEWGDYFDTGLRTGNVDTDGQIIGAGSSSLALQAAGTGPKLLFRVVVHADAAGTVIFDPSFDAAANHDSSFLNPTDIFTAGNIKFTSTELLISGPPTVSITPAVSQDEGDSGTTNYVFTVALSDPATQQATVAFATGGGNATAGQDYTATSGTLTFAIGESSKTITVVVAGDIANELDETFSLTLSDPVNAVLDSVSSGVGTITNDDTLVLSMAGVSALEGSAQNTMVFTVNLSGPSASDVVVPWNTENVVGGNAATGSSDTSGDYQHGSGTLTFAAGNNSPQFITITINGDTTNETNEDFRVVLTQPANATFDAGNGQALGTILNDDGPHITITPTVSQAEGNSGTVAYVFTVDIGVASDVPVTVQFATEDDTAAAGSDYTATSGTLTFSTGGPLTQQVTVLVNGDVLNEANESFRLLLSNPTGGATLTSSTGVATIENDDAPPSVSLSSSTVTLPEGDSAMLFTVNLSAASGQQVLVPFATSDGSATLADNDYTGTSGTLSFAAGDTQKIVTVLIKGDSKDEANETFSLTLSAPTNAELGSPVVSIATIEDDDNPPTASIGNASVVEGNSGETNLVFTVTLSAASGQAITIPWSTADDTATVADNDYGATSGTLTFAAGATTATLTVKVKGDTKNEPNEVFKVNLSSDGATNVTLADDQADGTITNDEALPTVSISNATPTNEGNSATTEFFFTVSLSSSSSQQLTVAFTTVDGSATVSNDDYAADSGTLSFAPGETQKVITVAVKGDSRFEADETFNVVISNPSAGMSLGQSSGQGLILNDDAKPTLSIADVTKLEGDSGTTDFVFLVTLSAASGLPVTVAFATSDGTATIDNSDYTATSGTLTFAAGVTTQSVTVKVKGDLFQEPNETFTVTLSNPNANATIADGAATGTIQNESSDSVVHQVSSIRGFAFLDTNKNGVKDANEKPMAGARVWLEGVSNLTTQDVSLSTFTLADGSYAFENVDAGTYQITFEDPLDYQAAKVIENSAQLEAVPDDGGPAAYVATLPFPGGFNITDANFASVGFKADRISQRLYVASSMSSNSSTSAPSVTLSTVTSTINAGNQANTTVSGTGTPGATVGVFASNGNASSATKTTTVGANGTWSISGIDVTALADGTITYTATASNANGTSSATKTTTKDATAPAVALSTVTTPVNGSNFSNASASGTGEAGATVSVTASDGTNTTAAATATVAANGTWSLSGLNLSNLKDGAISYTAQATDAAGNSAQSTLAGTKSALSVDILSAPTINNANKANLTASGTGQAGTTVSVTVTDGTQTSVAKTATVDATGAWSVTGIDASSLVDGAVTYRVIATNLAGDSLEDTLAATKDVVLPPVTINQASVPINVTNVGNASASGTGEVGATITLLITDGLNPITAPTATVAGDGTWSITGLDLSSLANGNIAYQVRATDAAGNATTFGPAATIASFKDVIVPTVILTTVTESIGLGNQTSVAASGTIGSGETKTVTVNLVISDGVNTVTKSTTIAAGTTTWSITDIDVSSLNDGTLTFTATATDEAGNVSASSSKTATKSALVVSAFTSAINLDNQDSAAIGGTGQVGATITVTVTDGTTTTPAVATVVAANGTWELSSIDLTSLNDGPITYNVTATANGTETASVAKQANKDTTVPTVALTSVPETINGAGAATVTVGGTGEIGATVSVVASDGVNTTSAATAVVGAGGTWSIADINVTALVDGTITFTATATDGVGNVSLPSSLTSNKDTQAPAVDLTTVTPGTTISSQNDGSVSVVGTSEAGATVTLLIKNGLNSLTPIEVVVDGNGDWQVNAIDVSSLPDGTLEFSVTAEDAAGNVSSADSQTVAKDTVCSVDITTIDGLLNAGEVGAVNVGGTAEPGSLVTVSATDGGVTAGPQSVFADGSGNWTLIGLNVSALQDGQVTFTAIATDVHGNTSPQDTALVTKDVVAPELALLVVTEVVNLANVAVASASGTGEVGANIGLTVTDGVTTTAPVNTVVGAGGTWSISGVDLSGLADGTITYTVIATDAAGNESGDVSQDASKDTVAPVVLISDATNPVNAANQTAVSIHGTGEAGTTVAVVISDGPSETGPFTVVVAGDGTWSISSLDVTMLDDGVLTFLVFATDTSGNESEVEFDTADKDTAIAVAISTISPLNSAGVASVTVTGTGDVGDTVDLVISDGNTTINASATVTAGGTWSIASLNLSSLIDGSISFTANATDAATNTAQDTDSATKDVVAPALSADTVTDPITAENAAATSVGGTAEAGASLEVVVTDGTNTVIKQLAAVPGDGNWTISDIDVSTFLDGTITYTVTATDAAGNETLDVITATATGLPSASQLIASALATGGQDASSDDDQAASSDYTALLSDEALGDAADWDVQLCDLTSQMADELWPLDESEEAEAATDAALEQFAGLTM